MNNTLIRKSVTTQVHKHHADLIDSVAEKGTKLTVRKGDDAAATSKRITDIFCARGASNYEVLCERMSWTEEKTEVLKKHFSDCIDKWKISMKVVSERIKANEQLNELFSGAEKKVLDKLRYLFQKIPEPEDDLEDVPNESLNDKMHRNAIKKVGRHHFL